jgi:hypothetical protein
MRADGDGRASRGAAWWGAVDLAFKAGIAVLATVVTRELLQTVLCALWINGFALLQLRVSPFAKAMFNGLSMLALCALLATAILSSLLASGIESEVSVAAAASTDASASASAAAPRFTSAASLLELSDTEAAVTVTLLLVNCATIAMLAIVWLRLFFRGRLHQVAVRLGGERLLRLASSKAAGKQGQGTMNAGPSSMSPTLVHNPLRSPSGDSNVLDEGAADGVGAAGSSEAAAAAASSRVKALGGAASPALSALRTTGRSMAAPGAQQHHHKRMHDFLAPGHGGGGGFGADDAAAAQGQALDISMQTNHSAPAHSNSGGGDAAARAAGAPAGGAVVAASRLDFMPTSARAADKRRHSNLQA